MPIEFDYTMPTGCHPSPEQDDKVLEITRTIRSEIPLYVAVMNKINVNMEDCFIVSCIFSRSFICYDSCSNSYDLLLLVSTAYSYLFSVLFLKNIPLQLVDHFKEETTATTIKLVAHNCHIYIVGASILASTVRIRLSSDLGGVLL
jgi:hypothetical protein